MASRSELPAGLGSTATGLDGVTSVTGSRDIAHRVVGRDWWAIMRGMQAHWKRERQQHGMHLILCRVRVAPPLPHHTNMKYCHSLLF